MRKRKLEIAVISDVHLGKDTCCADELLAYLHSIAPKTLILNGGIIDASHVKNRNFPLSHLNVLKKIVSMASEGTEVHYINGNHDAIPSLLAHMDIGNINYCKKLVLNLNGRNTLFFHGALFDIPLVAAKWSIKLGIKSWNMLSRINSFIHQILKNRQLERGTNSNNTRDTKVRSEAYISIFEHAVTALAVDKGYDSIVSGHIHKPKKELRDTAQGTVLYLNAGDWVENCTALEYSFKRWKLYQYDNDKLTPFFVDATLKEMDINTLEKSMGSRKLEPVKEL